MVNGLLMSKTSPYFNLVQRLWGDVQAPRGSGETYGFPIDYNWRDLGVVKSLLFKSRPSAIGWFVVSFAIDAVKGHAGRAFAHISQEGIERLPPFADADAARSVSCESGLIGVRATRQHASPNAVGSRFCQAVAALRRARLCPLPLETATGFGSSHFKRCFGHGLLDAAVAHDLSVMDCVPLRVFSVSSFANDNESAEPLTGFNHTTFRHTSTPLERAIS